MAQVVYRLPTGVGPRPMQRDATSVAGRGPERVRMDEEASRIPSEVSQRKERIRRSIDARNKPFSAKQFAEETGAIADKLRMFPDDEGNIYSWIDDNINPGVYIGEMASALGAAPLAVQEGRYGDAALAVATPLLSGALEQVIGPQITGKALDNLKYNTILSQTHRLNPFAYKQNPNSMLRGINLEGLLDAKYTGKLRAPYEFAGTKSGMPKQLPEGASYNYFDWITGKPEVYYTNHIPTANYYGGQGLVKAIVAEVPRKGNKFKVGWGVYPSGVSPDHPRPFGWKPYVPEPGTYYGPTREGGFVKRPWNWSQYTNREIPVEEAKFYVQDWLRGYKPISLDYNPYKDLSKDIRIITGASSNFGPEQENLPLPPLPMPMIVPIPQPAPQDTSAENVPPGGFFSDFPGIR